MSKIYFDTTPLIYFLDDEKPFSDKVAYFILNHQEIDDFFITSSITDHLATSTFFNCDIFLTNDNQLKQVSETNVVLVDDLML